MKRSHHPNGLCLAGLVSLVLLAASASAQTPTQPDSADHYMSYAVRGVSNPVVSVVLEDQFLRGSFSVIGLTRFLVPTDKEHGPSLYPRVLPYLHYSWYAIKPTTVFSRRVFVTNQFGKKPWIIENADFLLVPALKDPRGAIPPGPPPPENHYLCYRAREEFPDGRTVRLGLVDQFQQTLVDRAAARYLCNPCRKTTSSGIVYDIVRPDIHLALYEISPFFPVVRVGVLDQFLSRVIEIEQPAGLVQLLAVPSFKSEEPVPVQRSTWSGVKARYWN